MPRSSPATHSTKGRHDPAAAAIHRRVPAASARRCRGRPSSRPGRRPRLVVLRVGARRVRQRVLPDEPLLARAPRQHGHRAVHDGLGPDGRGRHGRRRGHSRQRERRHPHRSDRHRQAAGALGATSPARSCGRCAPRDSARRASASPEPRVSRWPRGSASRQSCPRCGRRTSSCSGPCACARPDRDRADASRQRDRLRHPERDASARPPRRARPRSRRRGDARLHAGRGRACRTGSPPPAPRRVTATGAVYHPGTASAATSPATSSAPGRLRRLRGLLLRRAAHGRRGGEPSPRLRWLLEGVVGVVEALCGGCRSGAQAADVARIKDTWLADYGYHDQPSAAAAYEADLMEKLTGVGHGVGLDSKRPGSTPPRPGCSRPA